MRWPVVGALSLALNIVGWSLFGLWLGNARLSAPRSDMLLSVVHVTTPPPVPIRSTPPPPALQRPTPEATTPVPRPRPRPVVRQVQPRPRPLPLPPRPAPEQAPARPSTPANRLAPDPAGTVPVAPAVKEPAIVLKRIATPPPVRRAASAPVPARKGPNLAALRASIRKAVNRHRHYPRLARRRGIEGRVILAFRLSRTGSISTVKVVHSAGRLLDKAALAALRRAAPLPYYPDWVRLPVVFQLED